MRALYGDLQRYLSAGVWELAGALQHHLHKQNHSRDYYRIAEHAAAAAAAADDDD
eukprot:COSAG05_NODE_1363_length_5081_cov_1.577479_6_plen_55_part_00